VSALVCAGVLGCASAVGGHGQGGATPGSGLSAFPTQPTRSALPTATTAAPPSSTTTAPPVDLVSLLETPPDGATRWTNAWGRTTRPTVAQFVKQFYPADARTDEKSTLRSQGVTDIAHRTWIARNANQIDLVLLRFRTAAGASSRYVAITDGTASRSDSTGFAVAGYSRGEAQGFRESGKDADGYVLARTYGRIAGTPIVLEAFFFSPHRFDKADLLRWTTTQLQRLG
jgi:hypothetical protein